MRSRLLDFLLFHIKGNQQDPSAKSLKNAYEKIVYNNFQTRSLQM